MPAVGEKDICKTLVIYRCTLYYCGTSTNQPKTEHSQQQTSEEANNPLFLTLKCMMSVWSWLKMPYATIIYFLCTY